MANPTTKKIEALTRQHVARYEGMKARGEAGDHEINVEECAHYLSVWRGVEAHGFDWEKLAPFQKAEVMEAMIDEEADRFDQPGQVG